MRGLSGGCLIFLLLVLPIDLVHGREWVDSTGKYRIKATLVAVHGDKAVLEKADGKIVSIPISRLSARDRQFLKQSPSPSPTKNQSPAKNRSTANEEVPSSQSVPDHKHANAAIAILKKNCRRCHGEGGTEEGGFGFAANREKLVSSGYVLLKDPKRSPLFQRVVASDSPMPPEGESPRPSAEDIERLRIWIASGAPSANQSPMPRYVSMAEIYDQVDADLRSLKRNDRPYIRYFSSVHLRNAGVSLAELETHHLALAKLANSLSWNRQLAGLTSMGPENTLYRIDLRDLKWSAQTWSEIVSRSPHALVFDSPQARAVRAATSCEVPIVRADWFIAAASRPPLYHELAQIPSTDTRLETLLRVDVRADIKQGRAVRVGFARSGVSQNNRLIQRHQSIFGGYWKSYDFAGNTGRKNLFENPLGPGSTVGSFEHDGGEIIFHLPNGMLGFMLTDRMGRRIDRGPIEIVSDPQQPDRTVVNGVSCMSCHYGGFIQKSDEIRKHVMANESAYRNLDDILTLYPEPATAKKWIETDTKTYLTALAKDEIGMSKPTRANEPIGLISNRYGNEIDLTLAAAELGMQPDSLMKQMESINDGDLLRSVGALKVRGGVVKRETFDHVFFDLALHLRLGRPPSTTELNGVRGRMANNRSLDRKANLVAAGAVTVSKEAEDALAAGVEAIRQHDWQTAEDEFAIALRLPADRAFTARIYENASRLYERGGSVQRLIDAHQFLLDCCDNPDEIEQARTNFFNSLMRFADKSQSWSWTPRHTTKIDWRSQLPTSVSTAVASTFEKRLQEDPDHEPTLRVMQTYWQRVHDNPEKRTEILRRLYELYHARGERIDVMTVLDMAYLFPKFGDAIQNAAILKELAGAATGDHAASLRISEAEALANADENERAIAVLKMAERQFQPSRSTSNTAYLVKIGDLYMRLNSPDLAAGSYRPALVREKNPTQMRQLQDKLSLAVEAIARQHGGSAPSAVSQETSRLLDPTLPFRAEAERYEAMSSRSPASTMEYMVQAAASWIKAQQPKQAASALQKAAASLSRLPDNQAEHNHTRLAALYEQIDLHQDAVNHWSAALKICDNERSITKYQASIKALIQEDRSIHVSTELARLIDDHHKYRALARKAENRKSYDANSESRSLVEAAKLWSQAGDVDEVKRVGQKAEMSIKRIVSQPSYSPQASLHRDLAEAYEHVKLYDQAISNLVSAIDNAIRDDDATKYHQTLTAICQQTGLPIPKLDPKSAVKLDPLNRVRVQATEYEERASAERIPSSRARYWKSASETWLKANEKERSLQAAEQYQELLMKLERVSDHDLGRLAELYEAIGDTEHAIQAYQLALEASTSEYGKKKYRERIAALK
tara:strand:+ start:133485 stop:137555 length:4071 start_codon:yes stop_codon:yes gene_type:complete